MWNFWVKFSEMGHRDLKSINLHYQNIGVHHSCNGTLKVQKMFLDTVKVIQQVLLEQ